MMDTQELIPLAIGAGLGVLGYFAGETVGLLKKLYRKRTLKKALLRELAEARAWLLRNVTTMECMLQLSALGEVANYGPMPIPVQVYDEHFPEINLKLKKGERVSLNSIYFLLHALNVAIAQSHSLNPKAARDREAIADLQQVLDSMYRNTDDALFKITWHIQNQAAIEASYDENRGLEDESANTRREAVDRRLLSLIGEARALGSDKIRKRHNDGAIRREDVRRAEPVEAGRFYVSLNGTKYKCVDIKGDKVTWMMLDSHQQGHVLDALYEQDLKYSNLYYQLKDGDEIARLERRYQVLNKQRPD